ncbi:hypothetical protein N8K70_03020 [Microbacterium betulae]|uniref:Uncharacterized protein n=1 Tax=Microbacterium betulae TaxID=2981139 RepID=A0AA97FIH7_9MICO|nr:hypothetical protein [Microbacterium sp. AB]WOF23665.1 hypothetical protein N8K70_03020 [Microbacterium sp. AB]
MPSLTNQDPGELLQKLGEDGARRAKLWLDSTTRVESTWSVYDKFGKDRLSYPWPNDDEAYSYDIGGIFYGGDLHKQAFLVECKKYSSASQGGHFDKFLAQSYVTLRDYPHLADHFIWMTWHPFRINTWNELSSETKIVKALIREQERVFGTTGEDETGLSDQLDASVVADLADRVWVIVLSDRQETLVISREDRAEVMKLRILQES